MKSLLLLHCYKYDDIERDKIYRRHDIYKLYKAILQRFESGLGQEIDGRVNTIIEEMNKLGGYPGVTFFKPVSKAELMDCIKNNRSLYVDLRYFMLGSDSKLTSSTPDDPRSFEIMNCLAKALIDLTVNEIARQKLYILPYADRIRNDELYKHLLRGQFSRGFEYGA